MSPQKRSIWARTPAVLVFLVLAGGLLWIGARNRRPKQGSGPKPVSPWIKIDFPKTIPAGRPFRSSASVRGTPSPTLTCSHPGITIQQDGAVSWPSPVPGEYEIVFIARNSAGEARAVWKVSVRALPVKITSSPVTKAFAGKDYVYEVTVEGTPPFKWELVNAPPQMRIDNNGKITLHRQYLKPGAQFQVRLRVSNEVNRAPRFDSQAFTVKCIKPQVKRPKKRRRSVKVAAGYRKKTGKSSKLPASKLQQEMLAKSEKEQKRLEEEKRRLEEEKRLAELKRDKAIQDQKKREEQQKILEELRRKQEEERKRQEEQRKKEQEILKRAQEAKRRRLEEERKRVEELRRKEAERRRREAEEIRRRAEEARRLAEQREKQERERARQEALRLKKIERERRLREEKQRLEEEKKRREEQQRIAMEQRRRAIEAKKKREEEERRAKEALQKQMEALKKQRKNLNKEKAEKGKKVNFAIYYFEYPRSSFSDFLKAIEPWPMRITFLSTEGHTLNLDKAPFIVRRGPSGQPMPQKVSSKGIQRLLSQEYNSTKGVRVRRISSAWARDEERLRQQAGVGPDYQMILFFSYAFIYDLDQAARAYYRAHAIKKDIPFDKGAGWVNFTITKSGEIRILGMGNTR